jgi:hypothetical protein
LAEPEITVEREDQGQSHCSQGDRRITPVIPPSVATCESERNDERDGKLGAIDRVVGEEPAEEARQVGTAEPPTKGPKNGAPSQHRTDIRGDEDEETDQGAKEMPPEIAGTWADPSGRLGVRK